MSSVALANRGTILPWIVVFLLTGGSAGHSVAAEPPDETLLPAKFRKLIPLHTALGEPRPGDWLTAHKESGQTFRQYVRNQPVKADPKRRVLYIQPLGDFTPTQRTINDLCWQRRSGFPA
jgi:hypothetical protein